jgi:hypothetical protein
MTAVNTARGEVALTIDGVELVLAASMNGLAAVSSALQCKSLGDLWQRLAGVEIGATLAAIQFLTIKGDKAAALEKIQLRHFADCSVAFNAMIAAHLGEAEDAGNESAVEEPKTKTAKK